MSMKTQTTQYLKEVVGRTFSTWVRGVASIEAYPRMEKNGKSRYWGE